MSPTSSAAWPNGAPLLTAPLHASASTIRPLSSPSRRIGSARARRHHAALQMPSRYLHDLISGAEMDLTVQTYPTFERLKEYCYRVAGTVGLTCTHVFGFRDSRALDLAEKLGLAFQLTNIIRDVHEDYQSGPRLSPGGRSGALRRVGRRFRFARTPRSACASCCVSKPNAPGIFYEQGAELLNLIDEDSRGTLWLLAHTYSALLARIEVAGFCRVRGTRATFARGKNGVHCQGALRAPDGREYY